MAGELGNNPAILNREFDSELRRISAYILQKKRQIARNNLNEFNDVN